MTCAGWGSYDGPCGAYDCRSCHPENFEHCDACGRITYHEDGRCYVCGEPQREDDDQ